MKNMIFILLAILSFGCSSSNEFQNLHFGPGPQDEEDELGEMIKDECNRCRRRRDN